VTTVIGDGDLYYFKQGAWRAVGQFLPIDLAPSLWLDASDEATIAESSGAVSQWDDKSGNEFHVVQAIAARQPVTGTRTVNGLNTIDFDGSDILERATGSQLVSSSDGTFTAFAVFQTDTITGGGALIISQDNSVDFGTRMPQILRRNNNVVQTTRIEPNIASDSSSASLVTTRAFIGSAVHRVDDVEAWADGASNGATSTTGSNETIASSIRIGANAISSAHFNGVIGEVIVFPRLLTTAEFNQVGRYLAGKWNITWTAN